MSSDATAQIMQSFSESENDFLSVKFLENKRGNIPGGHNVALENYTGECIVRIDAHAFMPSDFIRKNVDVLKSGESVSGGQVISISPDESNFSKTLLITENSIFCGGNAKFRRITEREYVDTMAFGLYRREVFDSVGKYNELLPRSEDNDMNYRVRKAGYRLCCDPSIKTTRFNRSSLKGLIKQKYSNGYWIGKTLGINPHCFSIFHFVPFSFVLGVLLTTVLALFGLPLLAVLMWLSYATVILFATILELCKNKFYITNLLLPFLFLLFHLVYGVGTLIGIIELPFWLRKIKKEG